MIATEVHLCGDERAIGLVQSLCKQTGDILYIKEYGRLSTLTIEEKPIMSFDELREGDAIVGFSKKNLF